MTEYQFPRCDHWDIRASHRCHNYWREDIELTTETKVGGATMYGTYEAGIWQFCRMHARIFKRDRLP